MRKSVGVEAVVQLSEAQYCKQACGSLGALSNKAFHDLKLNIPRFFQTELLYHRTHPSSITNNLSLPLSTFLKRGELICPIVTYLTTEEYMSKKVPSKVLPHGVTQFLIFLTSYFIKTTTFQETKAFWNIST